MIAPVGGRCTTRDLTVVNFRVHPKVHDIVLLIAAPTTDERPDIATVEPAAFVAVTTARSRRPRFATATV
jgi:hypothetical protein